jgi:hypothetical protein
MHKEVGFLVLFMQLYLTWGPSTWALASGCPPSIQFHSPPRIATQFTNCYWSEESFLLTHCFSLETYIIGTERRALVRPVQNLNIGAMDSTVQTVAADLRQGEHIPKMQNHIGNKSKLRVLRQRGGKEVPCCAVTSRAVPGHAARRSAWRCVLHNCREFKPDRIRRFRQRQRQKHRAGSNHLPSDI